MNDLEFLARLIENANHVAHIIHMTAIDSPERAFMIQGLFRRTNGISVGEIARAYDKDFKDLYKHAMANDTIADMLRYYAKNKDIAWFKEKFPDSYARAVNCNSRLKAECGIDILQHYI